MRAVSKGSGIGDPQILALILAICTVLYWSIFFPPHLLGKWPTQINPDFFGQTHKALVALDCSATALRKGRCTSALNTAANVMASPTTFLGTGSRCFKSEATKQLSSTY